MALHKSIYLLSRVCTLWCSCVRSGWQYNQSYYCPVSVCFMMLTCDLLAIAVFLVYIWSAVVLH